MNDDFVEALQAVFDANDPADGIDRQDGYGSDYRIVSLRVVESDDGFDDLEVTMEASSAVRPIRPIGRPRQFVSRVLFDRDWRNASGLDDLHRCAAYVVTQSAVSRFDEQDEAVTGPAPDIAAVLGSFGAMTQSAQDTYEVASPHHTTLLVHVAPDEWAEFWRHEYADVHLAETVDSRLDDENHIVFFRGRFHPSIRRELPPVRSPILREPGSSLEGGEWFAIPPGEDT